MFGISLLRGYSVSHRGDLKGKIVKKKKEIRIRDRILVNTFRETRERVFLKNQINIR